MKEQMKRSPTKIRESRIQYLKLYAKGIEADIGTLRDMLIIEALRHFGVSDRTAKSLAQTALIQLGRIMGWTKDVPKSEEKTDA